METDRRQAGFTLIELLVAMTMLLVLLAAAFGASIVGFHQQRVTSSRADALDSAAVGLARMVRETRQALTVSITDSGFGLNVQVPVLVSGALVTRNVRYDCTSRTSCVRTQSTTTTGSPTTQTDVVERQLANPTTDPVFTGICDGAPVSGSCTTVEGVRFTVESAVTDQKNATSRPITLQDSVALINIAGGQP